ncbi:hypothetical protein [Corynebacterium marinum]|uniref:hypothetical protein n=1 Tax=Corynebacterium marinum TaxID=349751 RepID=UPI0012EB31D5|nr:hypothetical protein [Corynebacterium marinum]
MSDSALRHSRLPGIALNVLGCGAATIALLGPSAQAGSNITSHPARRARPGAAT